MCTIGVFDCYNLAFCGVVIKALESKRCSLQIGTSWHKGEELFFESGARYEKGCMSAAKGLVK